VAAAKKYLKHGNYVSIINTYKNIVFEEKAKLKLDNVFFEDIYAVYNLDHHLRKIFLSAISRMEKSLAAVMSYEFCNKYREPNSYLDINNFCYDKRTKPIKKDKGISEVNINFRIDDLISLFISNLYNQNRPDSFVYKALNENSGSVPLWILLNEFKINDLWLFLLFLKRDDQINVLKNYDESITEKGVDEKIIHISAITEYYYKCIRNEKFLAFKLDWGITSLKNLYKGIGFFLLKQEREEFETEIGACLNNFKQKLNSESKEVLYNKICQLTEIEN